MVRVPAYRQRLNVPNTMKMWWEDASCLTSPAEIFEARLDGGLNGAKTKQEVVQEEQEKFNRAQQICNDCPVWHLCYQKASPDDFFYTMRAGIEPGQFKTYKEQGRVNYRSGQSLEDKNTCKQGHNNWKVWGKKRPRRKCVDCSKENTARQKAKKRAAILEA